MAYMTRCPRCGYLRADEDSEEEDGLAAEIETHWWVVPTVARIRAWLRTHEWVEASCGTAGTLWYPPAGAPGVGVPDDNEDLERITACLERIARRSSRPIDQVLREMLQ